ncbi:MAG TPA: biotin--[acetyl-CoA-carboxylase] ligase [Pyrinomonadaceae bacterium]|nr:biotin--[acetyl-CoA-carboxylase] ligase [Pyrinomonadaceae bacterium]
MKPTILRFDSIGSTNLEAMRQAKAGAPEGLCLVAREQTQGRGRLNRAWQSPKDAGLYLSIVLRPAFELGRWPLIGLMSALAVSDALARTCDLQVDIKWPNDICVNERKLGGILTETVETINGMAAIVGIGINLQQTSLPADLSPIATSIEAITGATPDGELILSELIKTIGQRYEALQSESGAEHTIREWCAKSSYAFDRKVRVTLNNEFFEGTTRGLESDGALRVETGAGELKIVRAGDVTALRAMTASWFTSATPDIQAFREGLLDMVDHIAAGGTKFQAGFTEMLCMWFDDYWGRHPRQLVRDGVISEPEHAILNRFSKVFRAAYPKGNYEEQDMKKLQDDATWKSVVAAAKGAQSELRELAETEMTGRTN